MLLSGCMPFFSCDEDTSNFILYQNIMKGRYSFPDEYWAQISQQAKDFIAKLLVTNPNKRITASEALTHPWLETQSKFDVLPNVRKNFNPKRTFKKAVLAVQSIRKLQQSLSSVNGSKEKVDDTSETTVTSKAEPAPARKASWFSFKKA